MMNNHGYTEQDRISSIELAMKNGHSNIVDFLENFREIITKDDTLPAEVVNELKFLLHCIWSVWSCFEALFTANLKKPPPGSSQVPPNVDPTSALEL